MGAVETGVRAVSPLNRGFATCQVPNGFIRPTAVSGGRTAPKYFVQELLSNSIR